MGNGEGQAMKGSYSMSERERRRKAPTLSDMSFDQALARFIQTDPREVADEIDEIKRRDREVMDYVEERRRSIRQGARRAKKRFRL
jgi:hypothetical protein